MNILIAGGTGLVGSALRTRLEADGHTCLVLSRSRAAGTVYWNPQAGEIDTAALGHIDAAVNLAGRDIGCRWTNSVKDEILLSRIRATDLLTRTLAALHPAPRTLVNASAIGFYGSTPGAVAGGNTPPNEIDESTPHGSGFLADVCTQWESATAPATAAGIRTVLLRIGVVISAEGGALKKMLPSFKLGLGGPIGDGKQWMSWIALDDLVGLIRFALVNDSLSGAVNAVAPQPVTNAEFTAVLGSVLNKPTAMRVPAIALKLGFGQMAEETVLSSARISAAKARAAGYQYRFPTIKEALQNVLPPKTQN